MHSADARRPRGSLRPHLDLSIESTRGGPHVSASSPQPSDRSLLRASHRMHKCSLNRAIRSPITRLSHSTDPPSIPLHEIGATSLPGEFYRYITSERRRFCSVRRRSSNSIPPIFRHSVIDSGTDPFHCIRPYEDLLPFCPLSVHTGNKAEG